MKKIISCLIGNLKRVWGFFFTLAISSLFINVNASGLRISTANKLILHNYKALTAGSSAKMPLLLAYKPDTAYFLDNHEKVYMRVDKMPEFPGGLSGLQKFCSQNMHYPEQALSNNKSGTVRVGFIVEKDGTLRKVRIVKSAGKELNKEAIQIVQKMPKWKSGELNGEKIPVYVVFPIPYTKNSEKQDSLSFLNSKTKHISPDDQPFTFVEHMPEFPGGENALKNFLAENVHYPVSALEHDIQGTVVLRFIVEIDGTLSKVQVLKSVGGGCDEEAIRIVKLMPNWVPGKLYEKNVRVYFVLPIKFAVKTRAKK
ncbi:MAG: energy transducer TonB [Bacteroidota bacterium]|nr:energy transducer TonB [Bacteroidota bacterium]MDP4227761.1 energy transducer TonB [Bacteroidota bacterium]